MNYSAEEMNSVCSRLNKKSSDRGTDQSFVVTYDDELRSVKGLRCAENDGECDMTSDCFIHACN